MPRSSSHAAGRLTPPPASADRTAPASSPRTRRSRRARRRIRGLDGLRALAVAVVIIYHLTPTRAPQGYLGVDIFFVLSGFLITYLLATEISQTGRLNLAGFWLRRARRILPALICVLLVTAPLTLVVGGDSAVGLPRQVASTLTFTYNWADIVAGSDYADATTPALLKNMWSLAVEEQFYLLWPLVILALLLPARRAAHPGREPRPDTTRPRTAGPSSPVPPTLTTQPRRMTGSRPARTREPAPPLLAPVVTGLLAIASSALALTLTARGADASRIHLGTDTHAYGLMLGATLALLSSRLPALSRSAAAVLDAAAWLATAGLLVLACLPWQDAPMAPVSVTASLLTTLVIASLMRTHLALDGSRGARALARTLHLAPLRWVGERSYGMYLWHWPVIVLLFYAAPQLAGTARLGIVVAASVALAALSYRYLERPVIAMHLGPWLRSIPTTVRTGLLALVAAGTVGCVAACALAPSMTTTERLLLEAQAASETTTTPTPAAPAPTPASAIPTPEVTQTPEEAPASATAQPPNPTQTQEPTTANDAAASLRADGVPEGSQITLMGDSVMLASKPALQAAFPGAYVDAAQNRRDSQALDILAGADAAAGARPYVVVGLASNRTIRTEYLQALLDTLGSGRKLILVNGYATESHGWVLASNPVIADFAAAHPGRVWVADWYTAISAHTDTLGPDQLHPTAAGGQYYAQAVAEALRQAAAG